MRKEVTAVVPTIGERTLEASLYSLQHQSYTLSEIVIIRDVHPFPEAMNQGVAKVKTPYVLQCDADMILHEDCVEVLLSAMDTRTGVCIGYLQDDLLGEIQAVKLYRTQALRESPFENRIASDSDGIEEIVRRNYKIAFASREARYGDYAPDVLGCHAPDYSDPVYVFNKFSVMGSIVRSRNSFPEYRNVLDALKKSTHEMADMALTAFCHGLFQDRRESEHKPFTTSAEFHFYQQFEASNDHGHDLFAITRLANYDRTKDLEALHSRKN